MNMGPELFHQCSHPEWINGENSIPGNPSISIGKTPQRNKATPVDCFTNSMRPIRRINAKGKRPVNKINLKMEGELDNIFGFTNAIVGLLDLLKLFLCSFNMFFTQVSY